MSQGDDRRDPPLSGEVYDSSGVRVYSWEWSDIVRSGDVIDTIVQTASDMATDLIVMSTDGRNGFLDALRGSHSERVLRRTPCPLLAIPAEAAVTPRLSASQE